MEVTEKKIIMNKFNALSITLISLELFYVKFNIYQNSNYKSLAFWREHVQNIKINILTRN